MDDLFGLIRPTWEPEHQILAGLKCLSSEEKKEITTRLKKYFKNGLPFQVKHDKLLYIYSFSLQFLKLHYYRSHLEKQKYLF